jgi:hypothetical protein
VDGSFAMQSPHLLTLKTSDEAAIIGNHSSFGCLSEPLRGTTSIVARPPTLRLNHLPANQIELLKDSTEKRIFERMEERILEKLEERMDDMERRLMERIESMEKRILKSLSPSSVQSTTLTSTLGTKPSVLPVKPREPWTPPGKAQSTQSTLPEGAVKTSERPSWLPPGIYDEPTSKTDTLQSYPTNPGSFLHELAPIEDSFRDEYVETSNRHWSERRKSMPDQFETLPKIRDVKEMSHLTFL